MRITKKLKTAILDHAEAEYPKESCGVVIDNNYIPCQNISTAVDQFKINPVDLVRVEKLGTIQAYVHSHPNGTTEASEPDLVGISNHNKVWLIASYPEGEVAKYDPKDYKSPLLGRQYYHGLQDCYSIIKDYYHRELNITLNDYDRSDRWWESKDTQSLYLDNFKNEGFVEVQDEIKQHDVILFTLGRTYHVNHAGVYLGSNTLTSEETEEVIGDSLFIHHPYNKNSIREIYGNYWNDRTSFILRHKELI